MNNDNAKEGVCPPTASANDTKKRLEMFPEHIRETMRPLVGKAEQEGIIQGHRIVFDATSFSVATGGRDVPPQGAVVFTPSSAGYENCRMSAAADGTLRFLPPK